MNPITLTLRRAEKFAEKIVGELADYCSLDGDKPEIVIAGSIRRRRPKCGDVDIVCRPRDEAARLLLRARAMARHPMVLQDGPRQLMLLYPTSAGQVQVDLFFATHPTRELFVETPGNWGTLLMCRTGSKEHNIWLASKAKDRGCAWNPHHGLYGTSGQYLAGQTEASIYQALELDFIAPEDRER